MEEAAPPAEAPPEDVQPAADDAPPPEEPIQEMAASLDVPQTEITTPGQIRKLSADPKKRHSIRKKVRDLLAVPKVLRFKVPSRLRSVKSLGSSQR